MQGGKFDYLLGQIPTISPIIPVLGVGLNIDRCIIQILGLIRTEIFHASNLTSQMGKLARLKFHLANICIHNKN